MNAKSKPRPERDTIAKQLLLDGYDVKNRKANDSAAVMRAYANKYGRRNVQGWLRDYLERNPVTSSPEPPYVDPRDMVDGIRGEPEPVTARAHISSERTYTPRGDTGSRSRLSLRAGLFGWNSADLAALWLGRHRIRFGLDPGRVPIENGRPAVCLSGAEWRATLESQMPTWCAADYLAYRIALPWPFPYNELTAHRLQDNRDENTTKAWRDKIAAAQPQAWSEPETVRAADRELVQRSIGVRVGRALRGSAKSVKYFYGADARRILYGDSLAARDNPKDWHLLGY